MAITLLALLLFALSFDSTTAKLRVLSRFKSFWASAREDLLSAKADTVDLFSVLGTLYSHNLLHSFTVLSTLLGIEDGVHKWADFFRFDDFSVIARAALLLIGVSLESFRADMFAFLDVATSVDFDRWNRALWYG